MALAVLVAVVYKLLLILLAGCATVEKSPFHYGCLNGMIDVYDNQLNQRPDYEWMNERCDMIEHYYIKGFELGKEPKSSR